MLFLVVALFLTSASAGCSSSSISSGCRDSIIGGNVKVSTLVVALRVYVDAVGNAV